MPELSNPTGVGDHTASLNGSPTYGSDVQNNSGGTLYITVSGNPNNNVILRVGPDTGSYTQVSEMGGAKNQGTVTGMVPDGHYYHLSDVGWDVGPWDHTFVLKVS